MLVVPLCCIFSCFCSSPCRDDAGAAVAPGRVPGHVCPLVHFAYEGTERGLESKPEPTATKPDQNLHLDTPECEQFPNLNRVLQISIISPGNTILQKIGSSSYEYFCIRKIIHFFLEELVSTMISVPHHMYLCRIQARASVWPHRTLQNKWCFSITSAPA